VPTGVKNAFEEIRKYVIGAHCDRVGHGTFFVRWDWFDKALKGKEEMLDAKKLRALLSIANSSCGDAMCNMLMLEAVLRDKDYSIQMLTNIYKENPSTCFKATVANKRRFVTNWDETKLDEPQRLQDIVELFTKER